MRKGVEQNTEHNCSACSRSDRRKWQRIVCTGYSGGSRIRRRVLLALVVAALAVLDPAAADEPGRVTDGASSQNATVNEERGAQCAERLTRFVVELDALLSSDELSVDPYLALLKRYFPVTHCDVQAALAICRQSKYLSGIEEWPKEYGCFFKASGFKVSFGLLKESGNSELPTAGVNKSSGRSQ